MTLFNKIKVAIQGENKPKKESPKNQPKPQVKTKVTTKKKVVAEKVASEPKENQVVTKKPRGSVSSHHILETPHISEKSTILTDNRKYVFKVYPRTSRAEIKKVVQSLYKVKVEKINLINIHRKKRILRGATGFKKGYKKAIVTLKPGQKIEITPR